MSDCPYSLIGDATPGMTLERYQELMRLPIAAFNGLNKPNEEPVFECSTIWKQAERAALLEFLVQAEEMREQELSYHLVPKYRVDIMPYVNPLILDWKYLIKLGVKTTSTIQAGVALNLGAEATPNDPVVVTVATTVTDVDEIKVFYPGLDCEIIPSKIVIAGGVATISIPRSRLVDPDLLDDRSDHLSYFHNANFLTTVDVKRVYYNLSGAVEYIWYGVNASPPTTVDTTQSAYGTILDQRLSIISHIPATLSGATWSYSCLTTCRQPDAIQISYLSGRRASISTEMLTIRLANTLMPNKPSSCPTVHQMYAEDIENVKTYTPYGSKAGALMAWIADSRSKIGHGGKFPSMR